MTRRLQWGSVDEKAQWLDAAASVDAASPWVQAQARWITTYALTPLAKADAVLRYVRDAIEYRPDRDPVGKRAEEFADTKSIMQRGFDDCDGKVRTFVALVRALALPGLVARVRPIHPRPGDFRHVQAEVRGPGIPGTEVGGWARVETIVEGVEIGGDVARMRRPDGTYPLAGPKRRDGVPR